MLLSVPFSIWKGGSVSIVLYQLKMALLFVVIVSLIRTTAHVKTIMLSIAISVIFLVALGNSLTEGGESRFQFEAGSLSNPNELANHFLIGLPLAWVIGIGSSTFSLKNLIRWSVLITSGFMLLKTGSRGGLVIAACLLLAMFLTFSFANKVKLVLVSVLSVLLAIAVTPQSAVRRYLTILSSEDGGPDEALRSRASRTELLRASISITLRNPIFGVGPANFVVAYNDDLKEAGLLHHWEATHNAYTQISSEMGLPALFPYLSVFGIVIKRVRAVRKAAKAISELQALYRTASLVLLSIMAYLVSGFFTSNAHQFYFPMLIGIGLMIDYCGTAEIRAIGTTRAAPIPAPASSSGLHPLPGHSPSPGFAR